MDVTVLSAATRATTGLFHPVNHAVPSDVTDTSAGVEVTPLKLTSVMEPVGVIRPIFPA